MLRSYRYCPIPGVDSPIKLLDPGRVVLASCMRSPAVSDCDPRARCLREFWDAFHEYWDRFAELPETSLRFQDNFLNRGSGGYAESHQSALVIVNSCQGTKTRS